MERVRFQKTYRGWEHTCKGDCHPVKRMLVIMVKFRRRSILPSLKLTLNVSSMKASPGAVPCDNTNSHGCGRLCVRRGSGRLRHHGGGSGMTRVLILCHQAETAVRRPYCALIVSGYVGSRSGMFRATGVRGVCSVLRDRRQRQLRWREKSQ
jgi:hypothetical protein